MAQLPELHLTRKDFRVDWFSGRGGGGQYRNKHQNCCRITHRATGLVATGQSHRERPANQREAFEKLARLVIAHYSAPSAGRRVDGEVVRHYVEHRNEVRDVASGRRIQYTEMFDPKRFGELVAARAEVVSAGR